jgi:hypothetical protein
VLPAATHGACTHTHTHTHDSAPHTAPRPQVTRSYESRQVVRSSAPADAAFVAELGQLVSSWLAGRPLDAGGGALLLQGGLGLGSSGEEEPAAGTDADMAEPAAAAAAAAAGPAQPDRLVLAPVNSFRRLLAFQQLRSMRGPGGEAHPGFWVTKLPDDARCLVLVRASAAQAAALEAADRASRVAAIRDAAGFAAVFDAMRASGKPCVGHNCMYDIAYGLYSFADAYLPAAWPDYKKLVRAWHPGGIWDTKHLARQLPEVRCVARGCGRRAPWGCAGALRSARCSAARHALQPGCAHACCRAAAAKPSRPPPGV